MASANPIAFWYGPVQRFGHLGRPQRWLNILGHVAAEDGSAAFALNGGPQWPLSLGCDLHRLARPGDFNIELSWDEVRQGDNTLTVHTTAGGQTHSALMQFIVAPPTAWPLPYAVDFGAIDDLQDAVQIVDGLWRLEADGARTAVPYYDRVLNLGDAAWTQYEAELRLTLHGFTPSSPGPPTYDVSHFGVALRWGGHHDDGLQPRRKWYPLGAQGEFLLRPETGQWRILFDRPADKPPSYADGGNPLILGRPMAIKAQIATLSDGRSRYRFKQWDAAAPEPPAWDVEGFEEGDLDAGSLCLVPHNSDVTIHQVRVRPL